MSYPLRLESTSFEGLYVGYRTPLEDRRGQLQRIFCDQLYSEALGNRLIRQINHTQTKKAGTVRGMHFQRPPFAEMKIVSCLAGSIFDAVIDLRSHSSTFLKFFCIELSEKNCKSLIIPEGFAHGFQSLTDDVEMLYLHTAPFSSTHEGGVNALDPGLNISWPSKIVERSPRDKDLPYIGSNFEGLIL